MNVWLLWPSVCRIDGRMQIVRIFIQFGHRLSLSRHEFRRRSSGRSAAVYSDTPSSQIYFGNRVSFLFSTAPVVGWRQATWLSKMQTSRHFPFAVKVIATHATRASVCNGISRVLNIENSIVGSNASLCSSTQRTQPMQYAIMHASILRVFTFQDAHALSLSPYLSWYRRVRWVLHLPAEHFALLGHHRNILGHKLRQLCAKCLRCVARAAFGTWPRPFHSLNRKCTVKLSDFPSLPPFSI